MEDLFDIYDIVPIEGKGLGCIAMQEIKIGTLILKEKPQCVANQELAEDEEGGYLSFGYLTSIANAYFEMSPSDQEKFLKLDSSKFNNKILRDEVSPLTKMFSELKEFADALNYSRVRDRAISNNDSEIRYNKMDELYREMLVGTLCVYQSNTFKELVNGQEIRDGGVGLKFSKFNHSCQPNAEAHLNQDGEIELRAISKIKAGSEISYFYDYTYKTAMKTLYARRGKLMQDFGFLCCCEFCQEEETQNDFETWKYWQSEEVKNLYLEKMCELTQDYAWRELVTESLEVMAIHKKMYNMEKSKKPPRGFILKNLENYLNIGVSAYFAAKTIGDADHMEHFKKECEKIAMAGEKIAQIAYGNDSVEAKVWMERLQNFEDCCVSGCRLMEKPVSEN